MSLFLSYLNDGGVIMWLIFFCSIIATFIFIEKWFHFHRDQVNVRELVTGLENVLKRDGIVEAISLCDNTPGPVARVLIAPILAYERGEKDLEQAIEDAAMTEIPRLERRLNIIATIAYITPLLGLLGTVIGMMGLFGEISQTQEIVVSATKISKEIRLALITTAGGLSVAIPAYIAYNYLVSRVENFTLEIEKASSEILNFFKNRKLNSGKKENAETS